MHQVINKRSSTQMPFLNAVSEVSEVCVHSSARVLPFFLCASGDCSSMQCLKSVTITKMSFHLSSFTGSDNGFHAVDEHKEIRKICRRCARAHDSSCQNNKYPLWNSHSWPLKLQDLYFADQRLAHCKRSPVLQCNFFRPLCIAAVSSPCQVAS